MITTVNFILTSFFVFIGHLIKSFSGFGAALLAIPILANFISLKVLIPLFVLFDFYSGSSVLITSKKEVNLKQLTWVVSGLLGGTFLGTLFLKSINATFLENLFGLVIAVFALKDLIFTKIKLKFNSNYWGILAGFLGGLCGALFGVNGPPIVIYLVEKIKDTKQLRGTLMVIFMIDAVWKIILFSANQLMTFKTLWLSLLLIPFMIPGLYLGKQANLKVDKRIFKKAIAVLLLINSGIIIFF
jgi:hypothetical protein